MTYSREPVERRRRRAEAERTAESRYAGLLALQRSAGNRAVARALGDRVRTPTLQRTIAGYPSIRTDPAQFKRLCEALVGEGAELPEKNRAAWTKRLFELADDTKTEYDLFGVMAELSQLRAPESKQEEDDGDVAEYDEDEELAEGDEEEEDFDDGSDWFEPEKIDTEKLATTNVRTVVVWAGCMLNADRISSLKQAAVKLLNGGSPDDAIAKWLEANEGRTDDLATQLAQAVNVTSLKVLIHQALDQELVHPEAVRQVVTRLQAVGLKPVVLRPDDALLLRGGKEINASWLRYGDPQQVKAMHSQLPEAEKTLLITVGHGDEEGATSFSGVAKSGMQVAADLKLGVNGSAAMYIPLQCFPQLAVKRWKKHIGKASASMAGTEKQYDDEMQRWIRENMVPEIRSWLKNL